MILCRRFLLKDSKKKIKSQYVVLFVEKVDLGADEAKAVLDIVNDMAGILKKTLLNDALEKIME